MASSPAPFLIWQVPFVEPSSRSIGLPRDIVPGKITTTLRGGELKLTIPRAVPMHLAVE